MPCRTKYNHKWWKSKWCAKKCWKLVVSFSVVWNEIARADIILHGDWLSLTFHCFLFSFFLFLCLIILFTTMELRVRSWAVCTHEKKKILLSLSNVDSFHEEKKGGFFRINFKDINMEQSYSRQIQNVITCYI